MIQDTSNFGGFSNSLLSAFREEHPKATVVTFACLSSISPLDADLGDVSYHVQLVYILPTLVKSFQVKRVLNDTLSLQSVAELCDLTVPILSPALWETDCWFPGHDVNVRFRPPVNFETKQQQDKSLYRSSAILSTHIETTTLPLR